VSAKKALKKLTKGMLGITTRDWELISRVGQAAIRGPSSTKHPHNAKLS
jgi:hypothetical protein